MAIGGIRCTVLISPFYFKSHYGIDKNAGKRTTRRIKALKLLSYEDKSKGLKHFSLEKRDTNYGYKLSMLGLQWIEKFLFFFHLTRINKLKVQGKRTFP